MAEKVEFLMDYGWAFNKRFWNEVCLIQIHSMTAAIGAERVCGLSLPCHNQEKHAKSAET
jgi:hypothetical protein